MKTTTFLTLCIVILFVACKQPSAKQGATNNDAATTIEPVAKDQQQNTDDSPKPVVVGDRRIIRTAKGDLNKDNIADSVLVYENAADSAMDDERSRYIEVYFANDKGYVKVASSDKAVQGYLPSNGADLAGL